MPGIIRQMTFVVTAMACAALSTLVGCAYQKTNVHQVNVASLVEAAPASTALVGVIVRTNYTFEDQGGSPQEARRSSSFHLGAGARANPLGDAPQLAAERNIFRFENADAYSRPIRKAQTLLEAYCAAKNDLEPLRYFEQLPTGFGRAAFIESRNAIVDSLAMVAHAYVDRSLAEHLARPRGPVGALILHQDAVDALLDSPDPALYGRLLTSIQSNGTLDPDDRRAACRILDTEALMFVAVAYDYMQILRTSQYGSSISSAIRVETDVAVFGANRDRPLATLGFNKVHERHLDGLDDVGKLVSKGLGGSLSEKSAVDRHRM